MYILFIYKESDSDFYFAELQIVPNFHLLM